MSASLFSKKLSPKATLLFDIGSDTVSGCLFEKNLSGGAVVFYTTEVPIPFQKEISGKALFSAMTRALKGALASLEGYHRSAKHFRTGEKYHIEKVTIVFSSPWHSSETKIFTTEFPRSSVITEEMVDKLIATEDVRQAVGGVEQFDTSL